MLEHRWYLSEREGRDVGPIAALDYYVSDVLAHRPDEKAVLGFTPTEIEKDTADSLDTVDSLDGADELDAVDELDVSR